MNTRSKDVPETVTKKRRKTKPVMTQTQYREHYERKLRGEKFNKLVFGMKTADICSMLQVSDATVRRWKTGTCQPPEMALELLRLRRGLALPRVCGDFAGFILGTMNGKTTLTPPGFHWSDGVSAYDVKSWSVIRHTLARAIGKKPAKAGLPHAGKLPANDLLFDLPVNTLRFDAVKNQAANDRGGNGE